MDQDRILFEGNGRERASNEICLTRGKRRGKAARLHLSGPLRVGCKCLNTRRRPDFGRSMIDWALRTQD
jgi:hypothetical protein